MKIAVCVCTYGAQDWLDRGDATMERLMREQGGLATYVRWHSETLAGSRNSAAVHASETSDADWVVFCDADDVLAPDYVWAMMETERDADLEFITTAEHPEGPQPPRILVPRVRYVTDGQVGPLRNLCEGGRDLLDVNCVVIGAAVPLAFFLRLGGFHPNIPIYEDWQLWLRAERAGARFVDAPRAVYVATDQPHSRNKQSPGLAAHWYQIIRRDEISAREADVSPFLPERQEAP